MIKTPLKISGIALAISQAFTHPALAQQSGNDAVVVVSGIRASAQSSVAIKRDTMEVVDSITAEDIGKLPDPNVAETLTRIPGVQGYRYGGEGASPSGVGSGVTIRGLSGQTGSQVNGRSYFTAGSREFNVESAIPGMVAGIDVYKNPSAEHIEGGIGGLVNIRTRNPSDFKSFTATLSTNVRENTMAKKADPELFGLLANRWDLGGGSRIGVMAAVVYGKSTGRSDSNPANGGANYKRAVRADTAEYATLARANTANDPSRPMTAYIGRTDINYLATVPTLAPSSTVGAYMPDTTGLSAAQIGNIMTAPGVFGSLAEETIMRTRRGLNLAADYRVSNTLRYYTEFNYTYYQYNQHYRNLSVAEGGNVMNLQTTPFSFTEDLANRNQNGGSNDVLASQRLKAGSFLNSTVSTQANNVRQPFMTWIAAGGAEWSPSASLSLKADFDYIKATKRSQGPLTTLVSAPGAYWTVNRIADDTPHMLNFGGRDINDPANYVLKDYNAGTFEAWDDKGGAAALSGAYSPDAGFFNKIKFGTRYATQKSQYKSSNIPNGQLTTNGLALAANGANAIYANSVPGLLVVAPTNGLEGNAGYAGGFPVYSADLMTGDQVKAAFPQANITPLSGLVENLASRRIYTEKTYAGYLMGEFTTLNDRIKGNVGVRVVRTQTDAVARVANTLTTPVSYPEVAKSTSYTNFLPSLNATMDITSDTLVRFGYGRGLTRPLIDQLNPSLSVNTTNGTASQGNPDLKPQTADSFDLSLERYFSKTNYVSAALFDKEIKGFLSNVSECQTLATAPAYTGVLPNFCAAGQYLVGRSVNAQKGYVRGTELSGQWFFDSRYGVLNNFGVSGSYTYVATKNPINIGTAAAPRVIDFPQTMQGKHNFSLSGMYEDDKLSARLVYTWRSASLLFTGPTASPIDDRYVGAFGILDAAVNYELAKNLTLSLNASNLTNKGLDRFVGEPGSYQTGIERQHYQNGRTYMVGLRYKFGL